MFALDAFVARCRAASRGAHPQRAVAALLREAVVQPDLWDRALCRLEGADSRGVATVWVDDHLTLVHVDLAPGFRSRVHDHGLWAAIGVYEGREDNVLYGRSEGAPMPITGRVALAAPEVFCMGARSIHHIENRLDQPLRALHAYGGDLRRADRSRFDPATGRATAEGGPTAQRSASTASTARG